jgi:hypothetical protein
MTIKAGFIGTYRSLEERREVAADYSALLSLTQAGRGAFL